MAHLLKIRVFTMSDRPSHNPQGHKSQLRRIIDEVNSYGFYPTSGSERMDACASGTPLQVPTPRFTLNGEVQRRPSAVSWMVEESTELMTKQVSSAEHYGYSGFVPCAVMGKFVACRHAPVLACGKMHADAARRSALHLDSGLKVILTLIVLT